MLRAILMGLVALLMMTPAALAANYPTPSDTSVIMQTDTNTEEAAGLKLTDLDPRYITMESGQRVGLTFQCPGCGDADQRAAVFVAPPFDPGPTAERSWHRTGEDLATISLSPSIRVSHGDGAGGTRECWHGYLKAGKLVSC